MENYNKEFADALGSYITNYRISCHPQLSQRKFAEKCNLSRTVIANLEAKKHSGNALAVTIGKIVIGLDLKSEEQLREIINQKIENPNKKDIPEVNETITIRKDSKLFALFEVAKDLSPYSLEMLHNIALEFKK